MNIQAELKNKRMIDDLVDELTNNTENVAKMISDYLADTYKTYAWVKPSLIAKRINDKENPFNIMKHIESLKAYLDIYDINAHLKEDEKIDVLYTSVEKAFNNSLKNLLEYYGQTSTKTSYKTIFSKYEQSVNICKYSFFVAFETLIAVSPEILLNRYCPQSSDEERSEAYEIIKKAISNKFHTCIQDGLHQIISPFYHEDIVLNNIKRVFEYMISDECTENAFALCNDILTTYEIYCDTYIYSLRENKNITAQNLKEYSYFEKAKDYLFKIEHLIYDYDKVHNVLMPTIKKWNEKYYGKMYIDYNECQPTKGTTLNFKILRQTIENDFYDVIREAVNNHNCKISLNIGTRKNVVIEVEGSFEDIADFVEDLTTDKNRFNYMLMEGYANQVDRIPHFWDKIKQNKAKEKDKDEEYR